MSARSSVIFLGSSSFAVPALRALVSDDAFDVRLVITQPDKPVGRKQILTPPPVKLAAEEAGIPVAQPISLNKELETLKQEYERPDFLVVVSYGQILSQDVLDWANVAPVNVHASLLPELRGASPLQHAILQGKTESGVTVQRMVKELDAGPILSKRVVTLNPRETFTTLHDKLALLGAELITDTLKHPHNPQEQNASEATFCGKLKKEDGHVDPTTMNAVIIDRMIRALTPWPGVTWNDAKLLESSLEKADDAYELPCAEGTVLYITKIQPASKKPMTGKAYLQGRSSKAS